MTAGQALRRFPLLAAVAAAAGCLSFGSDAPPTRRYDLRPPEAPPAAPVAEGPETVQVEEPTVDASLDREEMLWRRGAAETGAYGSHLWVRPPGAAVREALAAALVAGGGCAVAATEPPLEAPDYRLRVHLARCEEIDRGQSLAAALEIRVALRRAADGTEVLRRTVAVELEAKPRNPLGVAEALGRALGAAGRAVGEAVREALARDRELRAAGDEVEGGDPGEE